MGAAALTMMTNMLVMEIGGGSGDGTGGDLFCGVWWRRWLRSRPFMFLRCVLFSLLLLSLLILLLLLLLLILSLGAAGSVPLSLGI